MQLQGNEIIIQPAPAGSLYHEDVLNGVIPSGLEDGIYIFEGNLRPNGKRYYGLVQVFGRAIYDIGGDTDDRKAAVRFVAGGRLQLTDLSPTV